MAHDLVCWKCGASLSELTIEDGGSELLNETGVRHMKIEVQRSSPFTQLLERLRERVRKP